jgi:hypothetical protein
MMLFPASGPMISANTYADAPLCVGAHRVRFRYGRSPLCNSALAINRIVVLPVMMSSLRVLKAIEGVAASALLLGR